MQAEIKNKRITMTDELAEVVTAASMEGIDGQELARILGISKTALLTAQKYNRKFRDLVDNAALEVRVKIMRALMRMAEGYKYEEITYATEKDGTKRAIKWQEKWMPPDLKVAEIVMRLANPETKVSESPKTVVHKIEVTLDNKKLEKKKNAIESSYEVVV